MENKGTAVALLSRVIEPIGRCLTSESARQIVELRADETAARRVEELASKSGTGMLTPEERADYQLFVELGDLVALLQAKAHRYLAEHPGG